MAKLSKIQLVKFLNTFSSIAQKERWISRYDKESDSLSFSVKNLPSNARLSYPAIGHNDSDFALYVTPENKIKGIFIEYYQSNFLKHHKNAQATSSKILAGKKMGGKDLVELKQKTVNQKMALELQKVIKQELSTSLVAA